MFQHKSSKRIRLGGALTALLAAAVVTASLAGCGGSKKSSSAAESSQSASSQPTTKVVNGVVVDEKNEPVTDSKGEVVTVPSEAATNGGNAGASNTDSKQSSQADSKQQSSNSSASSKTDGNSNTQSSSNNSNNNNNNNGGSTQSSSGGNGSGGNTRTTTPPNAPAGNTTEKSDADNAATDLTVGGKSYKVGDKVVCTYFLEVPVNMLNFQGRVTFDSSLLKETKAYLIEPASYSSLMNDKNDGRVVFNGSMLTGYDFTAPGYEYLVVEYEVIGTGTTEPAITFDVITDVNNASYTSDDGTLSNGAKIWAVYS